MLLAPPAGNQVSVPEPLAGHAEDHQFHLGDGVHRPVIVPEWGFRALRSLIPVIAINESSDCDRPSERSDVRVGWFSSPSVVVEFDVGFSRA